MDVFFFFFLLGGLYAFLWVYIYGDAIMTHMCVILTHINDKENFVRDVDEFLY